MFAIAMGDSTGRLLPTTLGRHLSNCMRTCRQTHGVSQGALRPAQGSSIAVLDGLKYPPMGREVSGRHWPLSKSGDRRGRLRSSALRASRRSPPALTLARLSTAPPSPLTQLRRSVLAAINARNLCGEFLGLCYLFDESGILARPCLLDRSYLLACSGLHDLHRLRRDLRNIGGFGDDGNRGAQDLLQSFRQRLDHEI